MDPNRKKSISYFRTPPYNYTCAQAILKGFQKECPVSDELIDRFFEYRGGKAPEGVCGAIYAANYLLQANGLQPINKDFAAIAGSDKCFEIKTIHRFPCPDCINLADRLVEEKLEKTNKETL
ncbi:MAG: redox-active protein [Paludibacteraceae bacterium]|nr:redox-active protein [Paludibacteraceae bacterium]MBR6043909.1 redox-active protein [Paludibacteraceae bacterium]